MILDEIAAATRIRVERDKQAIPLAQMQNQARAAARADAVSAPRGARRFGAALSGGGLSFICEVKKASPSKGVISADFPYRDIAQGYEAGGADAVSCLTEPTWFMGSDAIFRAVRQQVDLPLLRKDFTIDEYQLYQARALGADAALLICSLLDTAAIEHMLEVCDELGMDALVEAHDGAEVASAVAAGARIIGVNNRNLKDFSVDVSTAQGLREAVPPECLFVAESGVTCIDDAVALKRSGADAVLVGEYLMRADDTRRALVELKEACS